MTLKRLHQETLDKLAATMNEVDDLRKENADLLRQVAECQAEIDSFRTIREAANKAIATAASPALIEEYARACHYAGSSGLAIVDWPQWLSRRASRP